MKTTYSLMLAALGLMTLTAPTLAQESKVAAKPAAKTCTDCADRKTTKAGKRDACAVPMTLSLSGLTCSGCAKTVTTALQKVTGVEEVTVDAKKQQAVVWVCPHKNVKPEQLTAAVKKAGYKVVKVAKGEPKS